MKFLLNILQFHFMCGHGVNLSNATLISVILHSLGPDVGPLLLCAASWVSTVYVNSWHTTWRKLRKLLDNVFAGVSLETGSSFKKLTLDPDVIQTDRLKSRVASQAAFCACDVATQEIWTLLTGGDRHGRTHALARNKRGKSTAREREEGRTQYQRLFTVATITARPFPHRRTHPHSPTRQMHLPAKIRPERGRTLSQRYQWRTYVSKHARKHAQTHTHTHTHTHTSWCRVSHRWFSLFSFLAGSPVYLSSLSSGTQRWSRRAMEPLRACAALPL